MKRERPEIYALRQTGADWQISRRDFLKAAGLGAAALETGLNSRLVRAASAEEDLNALCSDAKAHGKQIMNILTSADGRYLISLDWDGVVKCWDFATFSLIDTSAETISSTAKMGSGYFDGKSCLFYDYQGAVAFFTPPDLQNRTKEGRIARTNNDGVNGILFSKNEDLYVAAGKKIYMLEKDSSGGDYHERNALYLDEKGLKYVLFDNDRKFAVRFATDEFGTLDTVSGEITKFDTPAIKDFAILPGDVYAILIDESGDPAYRLISMIDGSTIWKKPPSELEMEDAKLTGVVITPDGTLAVLVGGRHEEKIWLISTTDGSVVNSCEAGMNHLSHGGLTAISGDGSKLARAVEERILFFSLPDLKIIGCPVDLSLLNKGSEGIEYTMYDPVTGETVTITLPCGAAIPAGAVCTCNCVSGDLPICNCVGYTKPGHSGGGGHYWHPN